MTDPKYDHYQDWKGWQPGDFGTFTNASSLYFEAELGKCGFNNLHGLKFLEFGFGNGAFAGWAVKRGAEWIGIEAIDELVKIAVTKGFSAHSNRTYLCEIVEKESLDIVIAFDVFEHFHFDDFCLILSDIYSVLRKGGLLWFCVPSGDSPFARAIQHGDLTHCQTLGSLAVQELATSLSYQVVSVRSPALPLRGLGLTTLFRRGLVQSLRAILYPAIRSVLMDGGKWVLSPTMVCVLRKS